MGRENRRRVINEYSWQKSAEKLIELYNRLLLKKKSVMFIIPNLGKGGAERVISNILFHLNRRKYDLGCVFYDRSHVYLIPDHVRVYNLDLPGNNNILKKLIRSICRIIYIKKLILQEKPDIVVSFLNRVNITVIVSHILPPSSRSRLVISERNTPSIQQNGILGKITKYFIKILYPLSNEIIAVSKGVAENLITDFGIHRDRVHIIYNPVDVKKINSLSGEEINEITWYKDNIPIIINVASLTEQKGQEYLLKAFQIVRKKVNSRLVILGEGDKRCNLEGLSSLLNISEDVAFLGFQKNPFKFISKSSVFVLSSLWEGFPNVLLEAMACGVPVISTDCQSGPNEIILNRVNGILVPTRDIDAMADSIIKILMDKEFARSMVKNQKFTINSFTIESIIKKYENLFEKL